MLDEKLLESIASQLLTGTTVTVAGNSATVRRTSRQHLKTTAFTVGGHEYQAIEQNPEKPSRRGQGETQKLNADHLKRDAYLYVRQSTLRQVVENSESTKRQYALRQRAMVPGWHPDRLVVIAIAHLFQFCDRLPFPAPVHQVAVLAHEAKHRTVTPMRITNVR